MPVELGTDRIIQATLGLEELQWNVSGPGGVIGVQVESAVCCVLYAVLFVCVCVCARACVCGCG